MVRYRRSPRSFAAILATLAVTVSYAQIPAGDKEIGPSGSVLGNRATATIDRNGNFRIIPDVAGSFRAIVIVPDMTQHRFNIEVPASRTVKLPDIKLSKQRHRSLKRASR